MGIKYLNKFLVKKCGPDIFKKIPVNSIRGIRIGVDSDNFIHILWSNALSNIVEGTDLLEIENADMNKVYIEFIAKTLIYIRMLCRYDITPVFIFDGPHKSNLKKDTQIKRRNQIMKGMSEYIKYRSNLLSNPLEVNSITINKLKSKYKQGISIPLEHRTNIVNIIEGLGLPYAHAIGEGEQLASRLCHESKVDAVLSKDTDCCAFGAPVVITELGGKNRDKNAKVLYLDHVLK